MTKLASIEELRNVLNKSNDSDNNVIMSAALEAVTPAMSGYLLTQFTQSDAPELDTFLPGTTKYLPDGSLVLMLRQALIVPGSVRITASQTTDGLITGDPLLDTERTLDAERGYVTIRPEAANSRRGMWYQVEYMYGFQTTTDQIGKVYKKVPDWLKQATLMTALGVYDSIRKANDSESAAPEVRIPGIAEQAVAQYRRLKRPVELPL